jgi:hypothetical protein
MTLGEYLTIQKLSGITLNEFDLGDVFGISIDDFNNLDDFKEEIEKRQVIKDNYILENTFLFNDIEWDYDKDITEITPFQFSQMNQYLRGENTDIQLLSLLIRPDGEKFDKNRLEYITNELYNLPVEIYLSLREFFFAKSIEYIKYMGIHSLNKLNKEKMVKKLRLKRFGGIGIGLSLFFFYLKATPYKIKNFFLKRK